MVVALVAWVARQQLRIATAVTAPPADAASATVRESARAVQERVRADIHRALEQGEAARRNAEP